MLHCYFHHPMATVDLSLYYPIPWLNTEGYVSMAKDLLSVAPTVAPPHVAAAIGSLVKVLTEVKEGLVSRIDEDLSTGIERSFDVFVDRVWFEVRNRLESYEIYKHEGTQKLTEADLVALDFDKQLERGRAAAAIHARLFGDGVEFLRDRYPQQATQMAARLDWLALKQLDAVLAELVTPEWANMLKVCQVRYEAMISERSARDGKSTADLRELRNKLRMQIYAYCGAIGSILDPNTPESAKQVEASLRPVLSYRAQNRRKGTSEVVGEEGVELAEPSIDEPEGTDADGDSVEPVDEPNIPAAD
jgi:hypothetical protein